MKKEYNIPTTDVVALAANQTLLQGSPTPNANVDKDDDGIAPGLFGSREYDPRFGGELWGEEK